MKDGITLLFNILRVDEHLCQDRNILKLLLLRCVESVGLHPVKKSLQLYNFPFIENNKVIGDYGLSGGLILLESHIYLHTWPELSYIRLEISSCKFIKKENVVNTISTILGKDVVINMNSISWNK